MTETALANQSQDKIEIRGSRSRSNVSWLLVPSEILMVPSNGETIVDHWWLQDGHGRLVFYIRWMGPNRSRCVLSPQCNRYRTIVARTGYWRDIGIERKPEPLFVDVVFTGGLRKIVSETTGRDVEIVS